jgi:hypothetical protein
MKISGEKLVSSFHPSGVSRGCTGWTGRAKTGEVESAVVVRRLDLTSERYSEIICDFFSRSSDSLVRVGIQPHPELWSWRFCAASS